MAQDDGHEFEKLKLEKSREDHRRVSSTFASLSLHHTDGSDSYLPHDISDMLSPSPAQHDLFRLRTNEEFKSSEEDLSRRLLNGEDIEQDIETARPRSIREEHEDADTVISSTASNGSYSPQHGRKASISFNPKAITSDGETRWALDSGITVAHSQPLEIPQSTDAKDHEWCHDRSPQRSHEIDTRREMGLHIDSSSSPRKDSNCSDGLSSLTSEAMTLSPTTEEPITPMNGVLPPANPAITEAEKKPTPFWPQRRTDSQRSRSYQRLEKAVNGTARRRSTRSANSSASPASAFLAQWSRSSQPAPEEPDDEGQEIAGSGWIIGRTIGYGGFSTVKECSTMDPKTAKKIVRAVKIMRKKPRNVKDDQQNERVQSEFEHEVALWRFLKHKYIVPLIAVYDTPFATFCITKLNVGGTLHDLIRSRRQQYGPNDRGLSAPLAKRYTYQLAAAIRYLHEDLHIVHRDIKLENCLLDMTAPDSASQGGNILLCDFGMADYIQHDSRDLPDPDDHETHNIGPAASSSMLSNNIAARENQTSLNSYGSNGNSIDGTVIPADLSDRNTTLTIMGSLEYAAPELISSTTTLFSPKTDIWSLGVCIYALLTGSLPFSHQMRETLALMIEKSQWDIAPLYQAPAVKGMGLAGMSAVELVKGCLTWSSEDRLDIRGVLASRWMVNCREIYGDGCLSDEEAAGWGG